MKFDVFRSALALFVSLACAALAVPACSLEVDEPRTEPAEPTCGEGCDDDNPCTVDQCVRGSCVTGELTGSPCSLPWVDGPGVCWAGSCYAACETAADCAARPCSKATCTSSRCIYVASGEGSACEADGVLGTCGEGVCTTAGE